MKRFHVNVAVKNLSESTRFYSTLFNAAPAVVKEDYAKWMLDDPRINFAISTSRAKKGINHVGLQVDSMGELRDIQSRLAAAGEARFDQPVAECCYATSSKTWVRDPDQVAWETFFTHGELTVYGDDREPVDSFSESEDAARACCSSDNDDCCVPQ